MEFDAKIIDKKSVECIINEFHIEGHELSILCQEAEKEESQIIQVPLENVSVKYSDVTEKPRMRLETFSAVPKSWLCRYTFGIVSKAEPIHFAYIEVPQNYKGILGNHAESNKST